MTNHKQKCEELRKARVRIAEKLGLQDKIKRTPCEFNGDCKGTCPACESEERLLSKEVLARTAAVAGVALALTGCGILDNKEISGDVEYIGEPEEQTLALDGEVVYIGEPEIDDQEQPLALEGDVEYTCDIDDTSEDDTSEIEGEVVYIGE